MDKASETRKFGESPKQAETGAWSPGSKGVGRETGWVISRWTCGPSLVSEFSLGL